MDDEDLEVETLPVTKKVRNGSQNPYDSREQTMQMSGMKKKEYVVDDMNKMKARSR